MPTTKRANAPEPRAKAASWDPDNDGDDDSTPEGDTDHDFWTADGQPIAAAWKAAGKPVPKADPADPATHAAPFAAEIRDRLPREDLIRAIGGCEVRDNDTDGSPGTLHGHLAVFNQWSEINSAREGHFLERLAPGAFAKTIAEGRILAVVEGHLD